MKLPILGLYAGTVQPMPDDGRPTAIFKQPISGPLPIGVEGLIGDAQADRRVHGGPEKAVHHFPAENMRRLAARFPEAAATLVPGGLGENISTDGADESQVCIGDVYALGSARVQLCQPRTPCWKIDARHRVEGITRYVAEACIAGWYYRVLAPGRVAVGEHIELLERARDAFTLAHFWTLVRAHRPPLDELLCLADTPGLNETWRRKLRERGDWLRTQPA